MKLEYIPEYYLHKAERCDNSEIIQGNLCMTDDKFYIVYDNDFYPSQQGDNIILMADRFFEVKPETVRRVSVNPIDQYKIYTDEKGGTCPNCDNRELLEHQLYCDTCGMAIDWS